ncbi:MAG: hypothetical protein MRY83_01230 [Flavobacteriales bacterium]|nr:hypothetical protein [Flavobacteriales bacterium]
MRCLGIILIFWCTLTKAQILGDPKEERVLFLAQGTWYNEQNSEDSIVIRGDTISQLGELYFVSINEDQWMESEILNETERTQFKPEVGVRKLISISRDSLILRDFFGVELKKYVRLNQ